MGAVAVFAVLAEALVLVVDIAVVRVPVAVVQELVVALVLDRDLSMAEVLGIVAELAAEAVVAKKLIFIIH